MSARAIAMLASVLIVACAANSGIVPIGGGAYMVSRQGATGFSGAANLKAESLREASDYCIAQRRELQLLSAKESEPPYILGNYPRAEIQFMCVEGAARR